MILTVILFLSFFLSAVFFLVDMSSEKTRLEKLDFQDWLKAAFSSTSQNQKGKKPRDISTISFCWGAIAASEISWERRDFTNGRRKFHFRIWPFLLCPCNFKPFNTTTFTFISLLSRFHKHLAFSLFNNTTISPQPRDSIPCKNKHEYSNTFPNFSLIQPSLNTSNIKIFIYLSSSSINYPSTYCLSKQSPSGE